MPRFAAATAAATAGALALALTLGSVAPAGAQLGSIDPATLGPDDLETIIEAVGSVPLGSTAGSLGSVGSADIPLGEGSSAPSGRPPRSIRASPRPSSGESSARGGSISTGSSPRNRCSARSPSRWSRPGVRAP
ncbi:MAG: hypothetical protein V7768_11630, partial [Dietzia cercidiphylli]